MAEREDLLLSLPDGQMVLHLSATERLEVSEDLLVAELAANSEGTDPAAVQNTINQTMARALRLAKAETGIRSTTGSYHVYEVTDPRTKQKRWRGRQTLSLKSNDAAVLLALVGSLQGEQMTLGALSYMVDPERAVALQDSLMEAALHRLQSKAARAAEALGKAVVELREVSVQGNRDTPVPFQQGRSLMRVEAAGMAAPVAEPGETTITLTVSGKALLKP